MSEAAKVFEWLNIFDSWNTLRVDEEVWLEVQRSSREILYSKCDAFVHAYLHISPLAPSGEAIQ